MFVMIACRNFVLTICLFAMLFSCGRETRNAVEIFLYRYDPQSSVSLQKERIYYGMLLQPIVKEGKLSLPSIAKEDRKNLPDVYVSYVSDYIDLVNTYLDKLPEEQRKSVLSFYEAWSIPDVVMSDYLVFGDSVVFSLGERQAVEMRIPKENYRAMLQTVKNFNTLETKGKVNYEMKNVGSLFMNHDLFGEVHELLMRDFGELNRKYKN